MVVKIWNHPRVEKHLASAIQYMSAFLWNSEKDRHEVEHKIAISWSDYLHTAIIFWIASICTQTWRTVICYCLFIFQWISSSRQMNHKLRFSINVTFLQTFDICLVMLSTVMVNVVVISNKTYTAPARLGRNVLHQGSDLCLFFMDLLGKLWHIILHVCNNPIDLKLYLLRQHVGWLVSISDSHLWDSGFESWRQPSCVVFQYSPRACVGFSVHWICWILHRCGC